MPFRTGLLVIITATLIQSGSTRGAQSLKTVAYFDGSNGHFPNGALLPVKDGNLYGTTFIGGQYYGGTIFRVSPGGQVSTLMHFDRTSGYEPTAGLIQANDGNFYGT